MDPWRQGSICVDELFPQASRLVQGSLEIGQVLCPKPDAWRISKLVLEGSLTQQNKVQEVRDKDRRLPGVPYLQTAAAPSGWYLIFYFTEKWGSIRVTYLPKRGPQAILQPPWPLSPLHVTGCPQLLSLGGSQSERRWSQPSVTDSCEQFNLLLFPMRRIL